MDSQSTFRALCDLRREQRLSIIVSAVQEYVEILSEIYNDIYESCIKVFYLYKPTKYKRHGDISGFNLYSAFVSEIRDAKIDVMYTPNELLPYKGVSKEEVLNAVVNGTRGTTVRNTPKSGTWPKDWKTSYPNAYSRYTIWRSSATSIESILSDFDETGVEQTADLFWEIVAKHI